MLVHIRNLTKHWSSGHGGVPAKLKTHPCLDLYIENPILTMALSSVPGVPILLLKVEVMGHIVQYRSSLIS